MSDLNIPAIAAGSPQKCNEVRFSTAMVGAALLSWAIFAFPAGAFRRTPAGAFRRTMGRAKGRGADRPHDGETDQGAAKRHGCDQGSVANLPNHFHFPSPGAGHRAEMTSFL